MIESKTKTIVFARKLFTDQEQLVLKNVEELNSAKTVGLQIEEYFFFQQYKLRNKCFHNVQSLHQIKPFLKK